MASIGIVSVHYEPRRIRNTLLVVAAIVRRARFPVHVCLVANTARAHASLSTTPGLTGCAVSTVLHDNSGWEFGAYQAGLERLGTSLPDWLVVVNDAVTARQTVSSANLDNLCQVFDRSVEHSVIAGQIESSARSFLVSGRRTHRWVTTNLFALNEPALQTVGVLRDSALDEWVRDTNDSAAMFDSQVDPVLRDHIMHWLFGERGRPDVWHAAAPLTYQNAAFMAGKARSILQEKRLSALLEGASAEFVDTRDMRLVANVAQRVQTKGQKLLRQLREL